MSRSEDRFRRILQLLSSTFLCTLLTSLAPLHAAGQHEDENTSVSVVTTLDKSRITLGDLVNLTVEVRYDKETVVRMPGPGVPLGEFELRNHRHVPPVQTGDGRIVARSIYKMTTFSMGELEIPPISIIYTVPDSVQEKVVKTDPLKITVESVLAEDTADIQDIKAPLEIPLDWWPILLAFAGGAALMAAGVVLLRRHRKRRHEAGILAQNAEQPPHLEAYEALARLRRSDLLGRGEVMRYHIEISEIIRRYFERRFCIEALEMTSRELLSGLAKKGLGDTTLTAAKSFLHDCDMVKFAKFEPSRAQSERLMDLAYEMVDSSRAVVLSPPDEAPVVQTEDRAAMRQSGTGGHQTEEVERRS